MNDRYNALQCEAAAYARANAAEERARKLEAKLERLERAQVGFVGAALCALGVSRDESVAPGNQVLSEIERLQKRLAALETLGVDPEPIHGWFGLSYASYLVVPRSILQSAPVELQARLVAVLHALDVTFGHLEELSVTYEVRVRDKDGRFKRDPLAAYDRGRRRVEARPGALEGEPQ